MGASQFDPRSVINAVRVVPPGKCSGNEKAPERESERETLRRRDKEMTRNTLFRLFSLTRYEISAYMVLVSPDFVQF